jgi:methylmalonic aciduria homocystinuria type C protein
VLADAGFDIAHELDTALVADEPGLTRLAAAGRRGLLVGNTRALWPRFLAARGADPALAADPDPIERYTETTIARTFPGIRAWFSHRRYDGAFLPFQRLAVLSGLGALSPTQLVIHPEYGPWFALRAVVVIDGRDLLPAVSAAEGRRGLIDGDPPPLRTLPAYRCTGTCEAMLAVALASGTDWRAWIAVRDACTVGRAFRYSEDQLAYHYARAFAR